MARVHQINVSNGGVPKRPVVSAEITTEGLIGDTQANMVDHGGPDRAVCLYSLEVIETLQGEGHPIQPGSAGENLTLAGLNWETLGPGSCLAIGEDVELEISSYTSPCKKNAAWFKDGDFTRIKQSGHPGESRLYARVRKPGHITTGDPVRLLR